MVILNLSMLSRKGKTLKKIKSSMKKSKSNGLIREVHYSKCLANVMIVKKTASLFQWLLDWSMQQKVTRLWASWMLTLGTIKFSCIWTTRTRFFHDWKRDLLLQSCHSDLGMQGPLSSSWSIRCFKEDIVKPWRCTLMTCSSNLSKPNIIWNIWERL